MKGRPIDAEVEGHPAEDLLPRSEDVQAGKLKRYVLGFAFNINDDVLLFKLGKTDLSSGLGGAVEDQETPEQAMDRIAKSETERSFDWIRYGRLWRKGREVWLFHSRLSWENRSHFCDFARVTGRCSFEKRENLSYLVGFLVSLAYLHWGGGSNLNFYDIEEQAGCKVADVLPNELPLIC